MLFLCTRAICLSTSAISGKDWTMKMSLRLFISTNFAKIRAILSNYIPDRRKIEFRDKFHVKSTQDNSQCYYIFHLFYLSRSVFSAGVILTWNLPPLFLFVKFDKTCHSPSSTPHLLSSPWLRKSQGGVDVFERRLCNYLRCSIFYALTNRFVAGHSGRRGVLSRDSSDFEILLQFRDGRRNSDKNSRYVRKSATKSHVRERAREILTREVISLPVLEFKCGKARKKWLQNKSSLSPLLFLLLRFY